MNRKLPIAALLFAGLWCSIANAQEPPPRTLGNGRPVRQANLQAPNDAADAPTERRQQSITPRREAASERPARAVPEPFSIWRILGSLLLVVGGIFGAAKLVKSLGVGSFRPIRPIPDSVCEILGVTSIPNRHTLYLVRMGQRVLLLGAAGENLTVLSEITDPEEVALLTRLCSADAPPQPGGSHFLSRLLNYGHSTPAEEPSPSSHEEQARKELEARLNAFAQS